MSTAPDYNASQMASGQLTTEHVTDLVRFWQQHHPPLTIDGMAGPATISTIDAASGALPPAPFLGSPMPTLSDGRRAIITSSFRPTDRPHHDGCDWFYPWRAGDQPSTVGDHGAAGRAPNGSPRWVVPTGVVAQAAAAGVVQLAGESATGRRVWIDHGNGYRSGYFHLIDLRVQVGQRVDAGAPVGAVGDNPSDNDGRHLHFELSPVGEYRPIDPELYLMASAHP